MSPTAPRLSQLISELRTLSERLGWDFTTDGLRASSLGDDDDLGPFADNDVVLLGTHLAGPRAGSALS